MMSQAVLVKRFLYGSRIIVQEVLTWQARRMGVVTQEHESEGPALPRREAIRFCNASL